MNFLFQNDVTLAFPTLMQPVAFLILFGLCAANAALFVRLCGGRDGRATRFFMFVIAATAQIIAITIFCGVAGRLNYYSIVSLLCSVLVILVAVLLFKKKRTPTRPECGCAERSSEPLVRGLAQILLCSFMFLLAAYLFVWAIVTPPPPSDALLYHLTIPTKWMQTGTIIPDIGDPFGAAFHPSNPETVLLWLILPFHEDAFANLISYFFWLFCGGAVFALARALGARREESLFAAAIWLALPLSALAATSSEVDLFAAFFFLAATYFLVRHWTEPRADFLAWGGAALGIYMGGKLTAIAFSLPLWILFSLRAGIRKPRRAAHFAAFATPAILLSSFWYASNMALNGMPFFPMKLSLFGHTIVKGVMGRESVMASADHTSRAADFLAVLKELFGPYLVVVFALVLVVVLADRIRRREWRHAAVLSLPFLLAFLFWFVVGINRVNSARYLFPAAAILCVAWALMAPKSKSLFALVSFVFIAALIANNPFIFRTIVPHVTHCLAGSSFVNTPLMKLLVGPVRWAFALAAVGGAPILLALIFDSLRARRVAAVFVALAALLFVAQYPRFSDYYSLGKYHWYRKTHPGLGDAWLAADRIAPKPLRIGVVGNNLYHGFSGVRLQNRVYRVDNLDLNAERWFAFLDKLGVQAVVTSELPRGADRGFPVQDRYLRERPDRARLFMDFGAVRIYILRPR